MSKGYSGIFKDDDTASLSTKKPINKIDYNNAESSDVKDVDKVQKIYKHGISIKGIPNSVNQKYNEKGSIISERYYNEIGDAYLDIDYTNHGNHKQHPIVPHQHRITIIGNKTIREKGIRIRK